MLTILTLLAAIVVASANSEFYDNYCKDIECASLPIDCPNDSSLKLQEFRNDFNGNDKDDDDDGNDEDDDANGDIEPLGQHLRRKRSLQYRPREIIKIIPSGNRNFEEELFKYHYQYQSHHNWKRDVSAISTIDSNMNLCCPKLKCVCKSCSIPKCQYADEVVMELSDGSNQPGNCCPKYQCMKELDCSKQTHHNKLKKYFWLNTCTRCKCHGFWKMCEDLCSLDERNNFDASNGCFSKYHGHHFENFESWKESDDDCTECTCEFGRPRCRSSFCKPLNCSKQIKVPGKCCKICGEEDVTVIATTSTESTTLNSTTTLINILTNSTTEQSNIGNSTSSSSKISTPTMQSDTLDKLADSTVAGNDSSFSISSSSSIPLLSSSSSIAPKIIETSTIQESLSSSSLSSSSSSSSSSTTSIPSTTQESPLSSTTPKIIDETSTKQDLSSSSTTSIPSTTQESSSSSTTISTTTEDLTTDFSSESNFFIERSSASSPIFIDPATIKSIIITPTISPTISPTTQLTTTIDIDPSKVILQSTETNQHPSVKTFLNTEDNQFLNDNDRTFFYIGLVVAIICATAFIIIIVIKMNKKKRYLSIPSDPSLSQSSTSTLSV